MTHASFASIGVCDPLVRALVADDHNQPTPIQTQAIPVLLSGRDLIGTAQTGTGKTAAFVLPMLQRLADENIRPLSRKPRALILSPTRELASQIGERIRSYGRNLRLKHTVIFGGVSQHPQVKRLARGMDILVATPGRLLDLVNQRHVSLDQASILVLDEADRMLDMGFVHDMKKIVALLPRKRQSVMFSATMGRDVERIAKDFLYKPERVEIAPKVVAVESIDQQIAFVEKPQKADFLKVLLQDEALSKVIVFTRTKHGADRVAKKLAADGVQTEAIHGDKTQGSRQTAIKKFRQGQARVLVATDVAARGIDVPDVSHVINFDLPNIAESYVHRIGRTGRAGNGGIAISFCGRDERGYLRDIERLLKRRLTVFGDRGVPEPANDAIKAPVHTLQPPKNRKSRSRPARSNKRPRNRQRKSAA